MRNTTNRPLRTRRSSVLILCEGSETEPNYLSALAREFSLTAISVPKNHDTDPLGLVKSAIKALKADSDLSLACAVFDRDSHPSFDAAVQAALQSPYFGTKLKIVKSYPCFELWLLYHFEYCRAPLTSADALARLKTIYPEYEKSSAQCMDKIIEQLPTALKHAKRALADAYNTNELNCSTDMHLLVADLIKMSPS